MRKVLLALIGLVTLAVMTGCPSPKVSAPPPRIFQVKYEVTGSAPSIYIIYYDPQDPVTTLNNISPPWSHNAIAQVGRSLEIYADFMSGVVSDDVTATIYVDGSLVATDTASAANSGSYAHVFYFPQ